MKRLAVLVAFAATAGAALAVHRAGAADVQPPQAAALYDRLCLACHGPAGAGDGPAAPWLWPRPRDFTRGEYKWRSTAFGAPPTAADLAATIRHGVPGTTMHAFGPTLDGPQIDALVAMLQGFAPGAFAAAAQPIALPAPPPLDQQAVARGQALWQQLGCAACHGPGGRGDGPAAEELRDANGQPAGPYDLTTEPLRRPRPGGHGGDARAAIHASIVTGLSGTSMPSYQGTPDEALWDVVAFVDSIRYRGPAPGTRDIDPRARNLDRERRLTRGGYWPGDGRDAVIWGRTIELQGAPPAELAPAQASVDADQCARCHAAQHRQWSGSLHGRAAGPGVLAQVIHAGGREGTVESCQRCHAPLAEQLERIRPRHRGERGKGWADNPQFDEGLRAQGINCAGCHVRDWTRHGPPLRDDAGLLDLPSYPLTVAAIYERSDFCLPCHQLPAGQSLDGRPLLDTYREWLEGPYMPRGIQCQHCHMPDREHTWKGVHDPATFRQGVALEAITGRDADGAVSVRARVRNVGAGHYLPTTPTPAAWLSIELLDGSGRRIRGARADKRIGRHLEFTDGSFVELEDTRIPPGQALELAAAWKDGRVAQATHARVRIEVRPDEYYERFYQRRLAGELDARQRALFEEALANARASHYVAVDELFAIE